MLLIVNPQASTVSGRLKSLVVYALRGRYDVEAVETQRRGHAAEITREAAGDGHDLVVAFGGDGTVNEAANGLARSEVPLSLLPGGSTNVVCRMLGIPCDVVDATEHLLRLADGLSARQIDLGRVNGRYFVASSGIGLDADTSRRVDERPPLKARAGALFFAYAAVAIFLRDYAGRPARIVAEANGERVEGVSAVVQNSNPFTYFRSRPLEICEASAFDSGTLSMTVLRQARPRDVPGLARRIFSNTEPVSSHPRVSSLTRLRSARVRAVDREGEPVPFPLQVDGEYIGDHTEAAFEASPASLLVVA